MQILPLENISFVTSLRQLYTLKRNNDRNDFEWPFIEVIFIFYMFFFLYIYYVIKRHLMVWFNLKVRYLIIILLYQFMFDQLRRIYFFLLGLFNLIRCVVNIAWLWICIVAKIFDFYFNIMDCNFNNGNETT